jgi:hypothetical protein
VADKGLQGGRGPYRGRHTEGGHIGCKGRRSALCVGLRGECPLVVAEPRREVCSERGVAAETFVKCNPLAIALMAHPSLPCGCRDHETLALHHSSRDDCTVLPPILQSLASSSAWLKLKQRTTAHSQPSGDGVVLGVRCPHHLCTIDRVPFIRLTHPTQSEAALPLPCCLCSCQQAQAVGLSPHFPQWAVPHARDGCGCAQPCCNRRATLCLAFG